MALLELLVVQVGTAVAKTVVKLWLKDHEFAASTATSILDALSKSMPDFIARRRTEAQFSRIAEEIGHNLLRAIELDKDRIDGNELEAAILAVADTFNSTAIAPEILVSHNLDPLSFERYLRDRNPHATRDLSTAGKMMYDRLLKETCNYAIEFSAGLPPIAATATKELLKRDNEIIELAKKILAEMPRSSAPSSAQDRDSEFEVEYRREVARILDQLELFGVSLSERSKRYTLSVAYITLMMSASMYDAPRKEEGSHQLTLLTPSENTSFTTHEATKTRKPDKKTDGAYARADEFLSKSKRSLIRGDAGSGKTTLLQWIAVHCARKDFDGALAHWNAAVPLFVPLRRSVRGEFPRPEDLPGLVAPVISGEMPEGWVHRHLRAGRAIVLIDGVDELAEANRNKARQWLLNLVEAFPNCHYIVTSRPAAVSERWLDQSSFASFDLQPMELGDIDAFIVHWHDAALGYSSHPECTQTRRVGARWLQEDKGSEVLKQSEVANSLGFRFLRGCTQYRTLA